jgi:5-methylcytosine-specific restriction protein A
MRRTPLVAKTGLKQGKPLERKTPMPRGNGLKTGGKALERATASKPKRAKRTGPSKAVMAILAERSGGMCELGIVCLGNAPATDPSHRIAKGMGGTKDPRSNTASNNLHACRACHNIVEADPKGAYARGWKIRHGQADPRMVPVWHWVHGWVLLDDAGGWTRAEVTS